LPYILNPNIALRGWRLVPHAYYPHGAGHAQKLTPEEFELLRNCDGVTDIRPSQTLFTLLKRGMCLPATEGEELTDWQRYRFCDNRYFPAVNWAITGKCNFNCRHCFNAADNAPLNAEFTWEQCQSLIAQLDECGVQNVTLTGGEPMLHPSFMDICREIDRRGMVIDEITTNGSRITSEMLDEFAQFGKKPLFKLSFDGVGHHDWFRMKEGAEREVIEKTKLLKDMDFSVRFQTNVHRDNMDTILPSARLAEDLGVEAIRVIRTTEAPRWAQTGGDLCLGIEEYYDFALDLIRSFLVENLKISIDIWQVFQMSPRRRAYHHRPVEGGANKCRDSLPVCRGNRGRIALTPEGDIVPCNQMSGYFKKHGTHLGNVHKTPLRELLTEGEYLRSVCYSVGELREENPKCQTCRHWKLCLGGCRAIGILFGGGYNKYDPSKCIYFDGYFDKFAALFDESWRCIDDLVE